MRWSRGWWVEMGLKLVRVGGPWGRAPWPSIFEVLPSVDAGRESIADETDDSVTSRRFGLTYSIMLSPI